MTEIKSSQNLFESLSALVDGEHNDLDMQRILNALDADGEEQSEQEAKGKTEDTPQASLRDKWSRYQMISAILKNDRDIGLNQDIASAVSAAIRDEQVETKRSKQLLADASWFGWAGKTAVAASVAVGVLFFAQQTMVGPQIGGQEFVATNDATDESASGALVPEGFNLPPLAARTVSTDRFAESSSATTSANSANPNATKRTVVITGNDMYHQIDRLMLEHAEQVSSAGALGAIPFARVTEIDPEDLSKPESDGESDD